MGDCDRCIAMMLMDIIALMLKPIRGNGPSGNHQYKISQVEFQTRLLALMEQSTDHLKEMKECLQKQRLVIERIDIRQEDMLERLRDLSRR